MDITAKISEDELEEIITEHLKQKGLDVERFEICISEKTVGHQMHEHTVPYFSHIEIGVSTSKIDNTTMEEIPVTAGPISRS